MHHDQLGVVRRAEEVAGVDRAGLGLQGEAQRGVGDDPAALGERVRRAVHPGQERDDLRLALQRGPGVVGPPVGQPGGDRVPVGDPVDLALGQVVVADGQGDQVRGHRLVGAPHPGALPVDRVAAVDQGAVGDRDQVLGHGHRETDGGGVARVVVDREPGRRDVGLADHQHAVVGGHHARGPRPVAHRLGDAGVLDLHGEPALDHHLARVDHQFVAVPGRAHLGAVDLHGGDVQADQVQGEPAQRGAVVSAVISAVPVSSSVAGS